MSSSVLSSGFYSFLLSFGLWFLCSSPRPFLLINCGVFSHTETTITTCGLIFTGHAHFRSCHRVASQSAVHAAFLTHCLTLILSFHFLGSPSARVVVALIHVFIFFKCFVIIFVVVWRMGKLLLVWLRNTGWLSRRTWEHQFILIHPEKGSFSSLSPLHSGLTGDELLGMDGARYLKLDDFKDQDDDFLSPKKTLRDFEGGMGTT